MNKVILFTTSISFLAFLVPHTVSARTSINVQNTVNGENSNVKVESTDDSSSSINLNQTNGETKIRLEQNGEVKTFETNGDEDINWNSEDGTAKVEVNRSGSAKVLSENDGSSIESTDDKTKSSNDEKENNEPKESESKVESFSLNSVFESIRSFFSSLFS